MRRLGIPDAACGTSMASSDIEVRPRTAVYNHTIIIFILKIKVRSRYR